MTELEKVIKGLEHCIDHNLCIGCKYYGPNNVRCQKKLMHDALELLKARQWISVKDRLPENQNPVVVFVPPHVDNDKGTFLGYVGMAYFTRLGEGFWCGTDGNLYGAIGMIYPPTHWMPLPEEPKEG